jgi:hypothetical protein
MNGIGELKAWASARVMSTGTIAFQKGCKVVKNGVGDFTITLDKECDKYEAICVLTPEQSNTSFSISPHDNQIDIYTLDANYGLFADRTFEFFMFKVGNRDSPTVVVIPQQQ